MSNLNKVREQLQQIIEEAAADLQAREVALADELKAREMALADLEARERAVASVLECRTMAYQDQIQAAFRDGMRHRQQQIDALIAAQLDSWKANSQPWQALARLRRLFDVEVQ